MNKALLLVPALFLGSAAAAETEMFDCLVEPHQVIELNSSVQGKIENILVQRSDLVEKGQLLVELESDVEKATVELARARHDMDAELKLRQASHDFARRKLVRYDEMYREDVVPLQTKDEVETEAVLAGLQMREAREHLTVARLELKRAEAVLRQRSVHSPINGVVVERYKSVGEYVEDEPILRLAQLDPLNVEVILPASMFGTIKPGMQARVMPEAPRNGSFPATVTIVDRVIDASSGTFGVRLELPNPDYLLPGGLSCDMSFIGKASNASAGNPKGNVALK
ncbi:MAG: efflux RND transporter periplasmic adaptor subunit [Gammaproteobacteria bacterium]|jgi:RND family efflux transporter MFP subunit